MSETDERMEEQVDLVDQTDDLPSPQQEPETGDGAEAIQPEPPAKPASAPKAVTPRGHAKKPAPAPAAPDPVSRQSLPSPGGQCNVRMGKGAIDGLGREAKALAGKPRLALLLLAGDVRPKLAKKIRRQLADGEFLVAEAEVEPGAPCREFSYAGKLLKRMAKAGITSDDVIVAVGDTDVLSLAAFVAGMWCGGTPLVMVPTDLLGCVEAPLTPRPLDVKGLSDAVRVKASPKTVICDTAEFDATAGEAVRSVLALCVATAMADNQNALNRLIGRADSLAAGDADDMRTQVFDTMKSRARMAMSSAVAVRQGLGYGSELAAVMARLVPGAAPSALLAEGMRFASRLAISLEESLDIDMVFAQDALLDRLGLHEVPCDLDPSQVAEGLREDRFSHSNRFLLTVPLGVGKVRLSSVPDDVLIDHLTAFCSARRALL